MYIGCWTNSEEEIVVYGARLRRKDHIGGFDDHYLLRFVQRLITQNGIHGTGGVNQPPIERGLVSAWGRVRCSGGESRKYLKAGR